MKSNTGYMILDPYYFLLQNIVIKLDGNNHDNET